MQYLPLAISFLPMKPKKGPWLAASSFFCLKYSWSSLALSLWNSMVTTFLSSTATATGLGGALGAGEEGVGGDGGTGFTGVGGWATGLLIGPSAWEHLIESRVDFGTENLKVEDDNEVEEEEHVEEDEDWDKGFWSLMHGNDDDDATDIFLGFSLYCTFFLLFRYQSSWCLWWKKRKRRKEAYIIRISVCLRVRCSVDKMRPSFLGKMVCCL